MAKQIKSSDLFEEEDIFKGLRESAKNTIDVFDKLSLGMKQSAEEMKKSVNDNVLTTTKSIENLMKTSKEATQLQEDSIKIDKAKAEALKQYAIAEQQLEKIEQEKEKTAQQKLRTQQQIKKEEEAEVKRSKQKAKAVQEETNAYKIMSAQARDLKNESKALAAELLNQKNAGQQGTASFAEMQKRYHDVTAEAKRLDTQLKDIDKSVGDNQRSVGDYEKATVGLKQQLRNLTNALSQMDESDPRFQQMAMEAGQLKDKIADTQAVVKGLAGSAMENLGGGFAKVGKIGVDAFQGIESAGVLLGVNTDALMETMVRLQALSGLSDALESLGGIGDKITEIKAAFTGAAVKLGLFTAAKEVDVVVTEAQAVATTEATVAQEGLNVAMSANPIGLVIAGILALGAAIVGLVYIFDQETAAEKKAAAEAKKLAEQRKYNAKYAKEAAEFVGKETGSYASLIYSLKSTNAGSKERNEIMKQINSEYGTTLKNMSDEFAFQEQLNRSLEDYVAVQYNKFKLQKNQEFFDSQQQKRFELEQKMYKLQRETNKNFQMSADAKKAALGDVQAEIRFRNELAMTYRDRNIEESVEFQRFESIQKQRLEIVKALEETENATEKLGLRREQLLETDKKLTNNGKVYVKQEKSTKNATDKQAKLNTEFELTNDYLSKQIELLNALDELKQNKEVAKAQDAIDEQKANDLKRVSETGQLEVDTIEKLVEDKYKLILDGITMQRDAQIAAIRETYRLEGVEQKKAIEAKRDELLAQEGLTAEAKKKIEENYQNELKKFDQDQLQRNGDLELEIRKINEETNVEIVNQTKQKNSEIDTLNDELIDAQIEYYDKANAKTQEENEKTLEQQKKRNEEIKQLVNASADFFIKKSEEKITQIDKEMAAAEKQYAVYQQLAQNGNINAQQSLAEQQKIMDEANLKKEKEMKKQERIKLAQSVFSTYSAKVEAGSENPLVDTIKDTTLLMQFINSLPAFYEGTETTVADALGKPMMSGRDGHIVRVDGSEKILNPTLSAMTGNMTTQEIAKVAQDYQNGKLIGSTTAYQMAQSVDFIQMVNKLDELKTTIENKPEHSYDVSRISSTLLEFVDKKKQGNTTTFNRYKVRR
jgi:hypothetical protein